MAATVPAPSVPSTSGKAECVMLCGWRRKWASQIATPAVSTAITTSSAAGFGTGSVCRVMTSGPPARSIAAACIVCGKLTAPSFAAASPGLTRHATTSIPVMRSAGMSVDPHLIFRMDAGWQPPESYARHGAGSLLASREQRVTRARARGAGRVVSEEALPVVVRRGSGRRVCQARPGHHGDAVDRAGSHAQLAPGTQREEHRMHLLVGAKDGVDRARWQAPGAADAGVFVDLRHQQRTLDAVGRIQGQRWPLQQGGERADGGRAARRALVDRRFSRQQGLGVRATAAVTAARALRLRQQGIDVVRCDRSEEHTSELQSLRHLVCRLLLEKKNAASASWYVAHHMDTMGTTAAAPPH